MDSPARSIIKAILWQIMGLISMFVIGALLTGSVQSGGIIAGVNTAVGLVAYILYERFWNHVCWGRTPFTPGGGRAHLQGDD